MWVRRPLNHGYSRVDGLVYGMRCLFDVRRSGPGRYFGVAEVSNNRNIIQQRQQVRR